IAARIVAPLPTRASARGAYRHGRRFELKKLLLLIAVAAVVAAGIGGWRMWAGAADGSVQLATVPVDRGDIEDSVTALGALQPRDYVDVGTQVSGQLRKIHVDIGDEVKQGDLLAEIDPAVYVSRVEADRAQLENLKAQREERLAQRRLADQQFRRQAGLMKAKATSEEAYQSAEAALKVADAQIAAITAQIAQTESTLRGNEANLGYTKIYAPMNGTVVSVSARQGQTLNANQQAPIILRIADLDTMTVWTQVSEADIGKLEIGMEAYFTTLGYGERRWQGKLRQLLPTPEVVNNVVLYNALFDVSNPGQLLKPQMTAQVFFVRAAAKDVLTVPLAAVRRSGKEARVQVMHDDGSIETRPGTLGVRDRISAEVTAGLEAGEKVVVQNQTAGAAPPRHTRGPRI